MMLTFNRLREMLRRRPSRIESRGVGAAYRLKCSARGSALVGLTENEDGSQLVEFAVALPLLMILITGLCFFGIALNNYMVLTGAVGAGARAAALSRGVSAYASDPCATAASTLVSSASVLTASNVTITMTITPYGGSPSVYQGGATLSCSGQSLGSQGGGTVTVAATYPVAMNVYLFAPKQLSLQAITTELIQ